MPAVRAGSELPAVDDRLVAPETPFEILDGELVRVSPADPPHAERHLQLCALIEAHTGDGFEAACDLLTRTSDLDDVAPDVSVYPDAPDPSTGGRQIEQLAFEVVSTQTLGNAGDKAARLARRGVRRVFAIDVEASRALEWSAARRTWRVLDPAGQITDAALAVALPIAAVIRRAKADDAVARALVAKRNPVLERLQAESVRRGKAEGLRRGKAEGLRRGKAEGLRRGKAEGLRRGKAEGLRRGKADGLRRGKADGLRRGKAEAVLAVLAARGVVLKRAQRDRILGEQDLARLERWITRALACMSVAELLSERTSTLASTSPTQPPRR